MAHGPVSTSIFNRYPWADNSGVLCHVQVTPITDPTPRNSVKLYILYWHFSEGPEGPSGQLCLWRAVSLKLRRKSEKRWKVTREEKRRREERRGNHSRWTLERTRRRRKESRRQWALGRQKMETATGNLRASVCLLKAGCNSRVCGDTLVLYQAGQRPFNSNSSTSSRTLCLGNLIFASMKLGRKSIKVILFLRLISQLYWAEDIQCRYCENKCNHQQYLCMLMNILCLFSTKVDPNKY